MIRQLLAAVFSRGSKPGKPLTEKDFPWAETLKRELGEGETIIDAHAGRGERLPMMARWIGLSGTMLAFEPIPARFASLFKLVAAEGMEGVTPLPQGLGVGFDTDEWEMEDGKKIRVSLGSLDPYVTSEHRLKLIVFDGLRDPKSVLIGARESLVTATLVFFPKAIEAQVYREELSKLGYEPSAYRNDAVTPVMSGELRPDLSQADGVLFRKKVTPPALPQTD